MIPRRSADRRPISFSPCRVVRAFGFLPMRSAQVGMKDWPVHGLPPRGFRVLADGRPVAAALAQTGNVIRMGHPQDCVGGMSSSVSTSMPRMPGEAGMIMHTPVLIASRLAFCQVAHLVQRDIDMTALLEVENLPVRQLPQELELPGLALRVHPCAHRAFVGAGSCDHCPEAAGRAFKRGAYRIHKRQASLSSTSRATKSTRVSGAQFCRNLRRDRVRARQIDTVDHHATGRVGMQGTVHPLLSAAAVARADHHGKRRAIACRVMRATGPPISSMSCMAGNAHHPPDDRHSVASGKKGGLIDIHAVEIDQVRVHRIEELCRFRSTAGTRANTSRARPMAAGRGTVCGITVMSRPGSPRPGRSRCFCPARQPRHP